MLQTNVIHCGECAEVMAREIPDGSIDLTVTSPPYDNLRTYKDYTFDFEAIAAQLWRVTKVGGVVVWVVGDATVDGSETCTSDIQKLHFKSLGFRVHDTMIYLSDKPPLTHNRYEQRFEYMFVLSKGRPSATNLLRKNTVYKAGGGNYRDSNGLMRHPHTKRGRNQTRIRGNVWHYCSGHDEGDKMSVAHPARFPEALARDHILSWSNPGDVVLDPMCGSGTTAKMSVLTDRQYIGIDVSSEYCDLARDRVARTERQPALLSYSDTAQETPKQAALFATEPSP